MKSLACCEFVLFRLANFRVNIRWSDRPVKCVDYKRLKSR